MALGCANWIRKVIPVSCWIWLQAHGTLLQDRRRNKNLALHGGSEHTVMKCKNTGTTQSLDETPH